jgi:serine/threonine protein kinase
LISSLWSPSLFLFALLSGWFRDVNRKSLFIVLEHCDGDLSQIIEKIKAEKKPETFSLFSEAYIWNVFIQICSGLDYLHSNGIMHRDIKPSNILYIKNRNKRNNYSDNDNDIVIKIADLGISCQVNDENIKNKNVSDNRYGTPLYYSPEMIDENFVGFNEKIDIWALGMYIYV